MPYDFKLPDLGEGIAEVELRKWLVSEGERIAEHQPLLEVETDKAVVEVPSPRAGMVGRIQKREGETVKVGEVLLSIAAQEEAAGEGGAPRQDQAATEAPRPKSVGIVGSLPEAEDEQNAPHGSRFSGLATPMVRRLAREKGIDLGEVQGSGPHGCIIPEDLERHRGAPQESKRSAEGEETLPLRGLRRTIAKNVLASQRTTAFVTSMEEADITEIWELRVREQGEVEARGTHLTFLPFFMKAAQHALREHPLLNATIDDEAETIVLKKHYHFGIAVDTPEGLMVPVIRDVDKKSIMELAEAIQELGRKARERTIPLEDLRGSSFTITNYGHFGGTFATPIINWPDVAILGFGRIVERPWVHKGEIAIRKILPLSLTFDHRATDGAYAARFLGRVLRYLEDPALLFLQCG
jgi:pyruvate dehydrogenase E2 component (dihydrolipoamide acetyltransferase)